jgi:hypothetical protein
MLLSALDPALLIHNYEDWQAKAWHCFRRCEALTLHRRVVREYDQKIAMSYEFAGLIYQSFPWNGDFRGISELRDLRQFILQELEKAIYIDTQAAREASLQPRGIVCQYVEDPEVVDAWKELLCGCVDATVLNEFDPQIATWETASLHEHSRTMILTIHDSDAETAPRVYSLPLVWDDDSWALQLVTQKWWPDLQRCVELHFRTNPGMRYYPKVREQPILFECTDAFRKSVERFCKDEQLRRSLIEALAKRVYGILDASLGDESLGEVRRFRVTDFWRVHYHEEDDRLVLEEFGPHSIGGVD